MTTIFERRQVLPLNNPTNAIERPSLERVLHGHVEYAAADRIRQNYYLLGYGLSRAMTVSCKIAHLLGVEEAVLSAVHQRTFELIQRQEIDTYLSEIALHRQDEGRGQVRYRLCCTFIRPSVNGDDYIYPVETFTYETAQALNDNAINELANLLFRTFLDRRGFGDLGRNIIGVRGLSMWSDYLWERPYSQEDVLESLRRAMRMPSWSIWLRPREIAFDLPYPVSNIPPEWLFFVLPRNPADIEANRENWRRMTRGNDDRSEHWYANYDLYRAKQEQ